MKELPAGHRTVPCPVDFYDLGVGYTLGSSTADCFVTLMSGIYEVQFSYGVDTENNVIKYDVNFSEYVDDRNMTGYNVGFYLDVEDYIKTKVLVNAVVAACVALPQIASSFVVSAIPKLIKAAT